MTAPTLTAETVEELRHRFLQDYPSEAPNNGMRDELAVEINALCDLALQRLSAEPGQPVAWRPVFNRGKDFGPWHDGPPDDWAADMVKRHEGRTSIQVAFASPQRPTEGWQLTPQQAEAIMLCHDALIADDKAEAYHQLYQLQLNIPGADIYKPFEHVKARLATPSEGKDHG